MSRDDDSLVYDCRFGWIDPEDLLGSLGVRCDQTDRHYLYQDHGTHGRLKNTKVWVPRDREAIEVMRAILDDAEWRMENDR